LTIIVKTRLRLRLWLLHFLLLRAIIATSLWLLFCAAFTAAALTAALTAAAVLATAALQLVTLTEQANRLKMLPSESCPSHCLYSPCPPFLLFAWFRHTNV
jgi:hypothetical protein